MPNITISGLPPAILPLDDPNTLFEVTVLEAGEEVSRRISLEDIATSTGLDASFITVGANPQLPNERILTAGVGVSIVDSGAGLPITVSVPGIDAEFLTLSLDGNLANERVLTPGTNIAFVDGGAGGLLTINASFSVPDPLLLSDGTAAAPTYSFASNSGSGVYLVSPDILGLSAGGLRVVQAVELGGTVQLQAEAGTAAVPSYSFRLSPSSGLFTVSSNRPGISSSGLIAQDWQTIASHAITTSETDIIAASTTQTQGEGQLLSSYNVVTPVANPNDVNTMPVASVGKRVVVINSGANVLQLFPSLGDDLGAGVNASITIPVGGSKIFLAEDSVTWATSGEANAGAGVDSFNTRTGAVVSIEADYDAFYLVKGAFAAQSVASTVTFDGSVTFTDSGGVTLDPTCELIFRNPADTSSTFLQSLAGSMQWGIAGAGFGVDFMDFGTSFIHFRFGDPLFVDEQAAANADQAGKGQWWVRDDVPNVPMFTDDAGTDFVLSATGAPSGTVTNSILRFDGAAFVETTQYRATVGATGFQVFDAGLTDNVSIGHNGTNGLINTVGSSEVIFGLTSGPTLAWRYEQMVRVPDGSAAVPGITWFGDVATGFFRGALGLSASITGVEQLRISNATTQVFSDDFRLVPNIGADSVIMRVDPPADPDDFTITLASLVDFHIIGAGLERFVLEELNLAMVEKAAAPGDVAGTGQFWVRDDVPNIPMYTDDTGTDFKLGVVNDVAQARRTTDFTLTTAFVDVTLDTTDVETDAAVVNHDLAGSTDNIIVGEDGTYKISYEVDIEVSTLVESTITADGRVRLNDGGTGIAGSNALCGSFSDGSIPGDFMQNHLSQTFYADLSSGDFVTLQLEKVEISGTDTYDATRVLFTVERVG